jgi:hypothetical protein
VQRLVGSHLRTYKGNVLVRVSPKVLFEETSVRSDLFAADGQVGTRRRQRRYGYQKGSKKHGDEPKLGLPPGK